MNKPAKTIRIASANDPKVTDRVRSVDLLARRGSKELVIAFMGAVGCGLPRVVTTLESLLVERNYKVIRIKLSDFIREQIKLGSLDIPQTEVDNRYFVGQTGGNLLRQQHGPEVLAQYAIGQIARHRVAIDKELAGLASEPPRIAYFIDQIKHPEEVMLFRMIYRNLFYLVGVMSTQEHRESRLLDEGLTSEAIQEIIKRDKKQSQKYGQQLEKAFKLADYFMHHPLGNDELIPTQAKRFVDLLHGHNGITPTRHEHAMYVAHSTALKSSCMSRQVGAVITDKTNRIIAVGTNDVPQYGGGLYSADSIADDRCFSQRGVCENVTQKIKRKNKIRDGIAAGLETLFTEKKILAAVTQKIDELVELTYAQSGVPDLIEFSRAVHAEMDALISLSRGGGGSTAGGTLYTTTFPCHNCARHIVAAGIEKVYYIEPYEKSLAIDSHSDSIVVLDHDEESQSIEQLQKVKLIHFSGVGPRLYPQMFLRGDSRKKDDGSWIEYNSMEQESANKIVQEYIDSYRTFEAKIAALFTEEFASDQSEEPPPLSA